MAGMPVGAQTNPGAAIGTGGNGAGVYSIAGTVVNGLSGEPLRRATVAVLAVEDSHTIESVETGSDGRFSLQGLPAAKYQLTASKRGFRTAFYDEHEEYSTAIVTGADQETGQLVFRLTPSSTLHGVVTADGGDPVEGAKVMLFLVPPEHARPSGRGRGPNERIAQVDAATTDDTGAYEFANLAAGKYLLAVTATPWYALHLSSTDAGAKAGGSGTALDVAYPVTFYDSTTDEASATPIVLGAGSREEANLFLHATPALHIFVQAPHGQTNPNEFAIPVMQRSIFGTQVSSETQLTINPGLSNLAEFTGVAPGPYQLQQGNPPRVVDLDAATSQQVDPASGTPTVPVSGTLASSWGSALPDEVNMVLSSLEDGRHQEQLVAGARKGEFQFNSVLPGKWELHAWGPVGELAVVSIAANGAAHAGNMLTVGDRALTVTATLAQGVARVEGFARRETKGVAGVMVVLAPKNKAAFRALVRRDQSDSDGSFSLRDAAPGQYTVVAIENGWELDWSRPEVLARFLPKGVAVSVTESSGKTIQLLEAVPVQTQ
jgi:hypothetical protein